MAASNAIAAYGTLIKRGDGNGGSEAFTAIAEVDTINGMSLKMDTDDVTHMQSTGRWKEFVGTCLDAGEIALDVNFIPTNATQSQSAGLLADMKSFVKRNFQMVFSDIGVTTWTFTALVVGFDMKAPHDKSLSATFKLKITGAPGMAG